MTPSQPSRGQEVPEIPLCDLQADCAQRRRMHAGCAVCMTRSLAVCSALPADESHALEEVAAQLRLGPGAVLAREGDPRREVYTVTRGMMRRTRLLPDGRRFVAGFLLPGDFIGFSSDAVYRHTIEAVTESQLCTISLTNMRRLCERYPDFEKGLLEQACGELDNTRSNLMALARMTPVERLAAFLVELSERQVRRGGRKDHVDLPMTRADIADHLGLTIETVSRSFSKLKQEGVLFFEHPHHIELRDPDKLRSMAGL